jgi:uncharacterized protein (DUF3084 family)
MCEPTNPDSQAAVTVLNKKQADAIAAFALQYTRVQRQVLQLGGEVHTLVEQLRKVVEEMQALIEKAARVQAALKVIVGTVTE